MTALTRVRRRTALLVAVLCAATAALTGPAGAVRAAPPGAVPAGPAGVALRPGTADWPSWQRDLEGSRFNGAEHTLTPATVGRLRLKWAFAFPKVPVLTSGSQPAVVGGTMYFGGPDGYFYAVDARTGATRWTFALNTVEPGVGQAVVRNGPLVAAGKVYFGDYRGYLYALALGTGELVWSTRLDSHPAAMVTSSPQYHGGRLYVGVSSGDNVGGVDHACCTFRGHLDSIDAETGQLRWRYYTVPEPQAVGTWPSGATRYEPSGAGVWSSPVIDRETGTVFVGTGQNYTGTTGDSDTVLALDARTGAVRWKRQMTHPDSWRVLCANPNVPPGYCPGLQDGTALDFDFGALPNLMTVNGRRLVGIGQKSGVYHTFDARTGEIVWQRQLSEPMPNSGLSGIMWGASYDGRRLYVATYQADPGTLFALNPADGAILWSTPNPADGCSWGGAAAYPETCDLAHGPAVTSTPGLVWEGSSDGKMRAYSAATGRVLWQHDTIQDYAGVNGLAGRGSAVSAGGGAVVSRGMLYVHSGYRPFYPSDKGFVLLAYGL
ncbi:PQQ-binding-like beta-propeller repeat protein [Solwaraspora sp. WMMD792]|uniref:outer membrane protein assembly factor BamB family protein n=1 Tax=Micromonosporaceae TaxID=28056 RepID=UPI0024177742|nr:PQQ-binding-like beta-propeller repeat protein [Solwaraspora sp. WMMD792]MDG4770717.1 PQQ-binding-like beta-propeller repeat protein [Solwaraspora sp. WMMD792]UHY14146.1 PQQ-dependent enzyme [Verrucosispora sp.]